MDRLGEDEVGGEGEGRRAASPLSSASFDPAASVHIAFRAAAIVRVEESTWPAPPRASRAVGAVSAQADNQTRHYVEIFGLALRVGN